MIQELRIFTLGGVAVSLDDEPVAGFDSRKVAGLLVYMACTNRPHQRENLAEFFWEDRAQPQSFSNLRAALTRLRSYAGPYVTITRQTIGMNADSNWRLDVADFETNINSAYLQPTRSQLEMALSLYRGDFLDGFYINSDSFNEWARLERERLRFSMMDCLDRLIEYCDLQEEYQDGLAYATQLLKMDPMREQTHRHLMLLLAKHGQRTAAMAQYETCKELLSGELGIAPAVETTALYERIRSGNSGLTPIPAPPYPQDTLVLSTHNNPYKGLRAFAELDAADFFGREKLTNRLLHRMSETSPYSRFLAIVGPSGSGKSSIVRAGIIPALRQGVVPGSSAWRIAQITPGTRPFEELEIALVRISGDPGAQLIDHLQRDTRGLLRTVRTVLPDNTAELLLVIDQFEEIFTLGIDPAEVQFLLESLYIAVIDERSPVRILITLRADFFDRPLMHQHFSEIIRYRTEAIPPMTPEELEQAIVRPAKRVGVAVEAGLSTTLVAEVKEQPGALPMLEYALTKLFMQRKSDLLTLADYDAIGGALGALTHHADAIYASFDQEAQIAARQIFMRLISLNQDTKATRRRVLQSELWVVGGTATGRVLERFGNSRLLTFDLDPTTASPTVELAHEAIIREWEQLRMWLDEARDDIRKQRVLASAATQWIEARRDHSYLLHGSRLMEFAAWAEKTHVALTDPEQLFLSASKDEHRRLTSRRRLTRRLVYAVTVLVAVVMTGLALLATDRAAEARHEAAINHSLILAHQADHAADSGKLDLSLLLALEAARIEDSPPEAMRTLSTIAFGAGIEAVLNGHRYEVKTVAFSPDSHWGISGSCGLLVDHDCTQGEIIVWDLGSGTEYQRLNRHTDWVNSVAFNPTADADRPMAVSASDDRTLILWDVLSGEVMRRYDGHTDAVNSVAFSPDGQLIASGSEDATVILWDADTGTMIRQQGSPQADGHTAAVNSVVFSPDGQTIASCSDDATIILWDVATGAVVKRLTGHTSGIQSIAFTPDGSEIVSGGADFTLRLWDIETGNEIRRSNVRVLKGYLAMHPNGQTVMADGASSVDIWDIRQLTLSRVFNLPQQTEIITAGALNTTGTLALNGSENGTVYFWSQGNYIPVQSIEIENFTLFDVDIDADGRRLLLGSWGGNTAILWHNETHEEIRRLDEPESSLYPVRFSPDGKLALIGATNITDSTAGTSLTLWDLETGEQLRQLHGHEYYLRSLAFSPDGTTALSGSQRYGPAWPNETGIDGRLILWDLETGREIRRFDTVDDISDITFNVDGSQVLTTSAMHPDVILWDVATGTQDTRFSTGGAITFRAVFGPDEKSVIASVGGTNRGLIQWDIETGSVIRHYTGHESGVWALAISPDRRYLVSGDTNGMIIFWSVETGEALLRFRGHSALVWNLKFSPDGETFYSSSLDGSIRQWQSATAWNQQELIDWVYENRYIREFTCEERTAYRIRPACDGM